MSSPLISVLMPVYNQEKLVARSVQSILNQSVSDFELIIIDDGSSDETLSSIQNFRDNRIRIFSKKQNGGIARALNDGLEIAKGRFVARMDSDDYAVPNRFEAQIEVFRSFPNLAVLGTAMRVSGSKKYLGVPLDHESIGSRLRFANAIHHPTVMMNLDVIPSSELHYNPERVPAEDYELWTRLFGSGLEFANIPLASVHYSPHVKVRDEYVHRQRQQSAAIAATFCLRDFAEPKSGELQIWAKYLSFHDNKLADDELRALLEIRDKIVASSSPSARILFEDDFYRVWKTLVAYQSMRDGLKNLYLLMIDQRINPRFFCAVVLGQFQRVRRKLGEWRRRLIPLF